MRNNNPMKCCLGRIWQVDGKRYAALPVQEQTVRKLLDPAFRTPNLFRRLLHCSLEPTTPRDLQIACIAESAVFVTENDDVIFKDNEQIADFLSVALPSWPTLIAVNSGIAP